MPIVGPPTSGGRGTRARRSPFAVRLRPFASFSINTLTVLGGGGDNTYNVTGSPASALTLNDSNGGDTAGVLEKLQKNS
jgi:hypothetical protein